MATNSPKATDTQLRRINKRLEGILNSVGKNSKLYNDIKNYIMSLYPGRTKNLVRDHGKIALKRGKTSTISAIDAARIEEYIGKHNLVDYKRQIREFAKETGRRARTVREYKELAKEMFDISNEYDDALQYLYKLSSRPGYRKLMQDISHRGKRLTYAEMRDNIDKINAFIGKKQVISPFA